MNRLALLMAAAAVAVLSSGCGNKGSPADAPKDVTLVPGDSAVTVSWTMEPDVNYWIFYAPGSNVTTSNWATIGGAVIPGAISPRLVTGLVNGQTYSFTINGRKNGGPGGEGSPTQVSVPRIAGSTWTLGTPLGTGRLNAVGAGILTTGSVYVTVGAGGLIYVSTNGSATVPATNPAAPADLYGTWYVAGIGFLATGAGGTVVLSADGTTWETQASGTSATLYAGTSTGATGIIAVGAAGTMIGSADGRSWVPIDSGTSNHLYAAVYGNGRYVVVGANGTMLTSTDGVTWTAIDTTTTRDLRSVTLGVLNPTSATPTVIFAAVGDGGTLLTSNDGLAWTLQAPIAPVDFAGVTFTSQFAAVGKAGAVYTSLDGLTWVAQSSGTSNDLTAVSRIIAGFAAVGDQGTNIFSY